MAGAFGPFFDAQVNRFGIDFVATENNAFGIDPFPSAAPAPFPVPLAIYDFNEYFQYQPEISNQVPGSPIGGATIHLEFNNFFDDTNLANKNLVIYAPDNGGGLTGGITTPTITGMQSIEMWVNLAYDESGGNYGQYFIDGREGLNAGFIIGAETGSGSVGDGWVGQKIYYTNINATSEAITGITNPMAQIVYRGWTQVVLVRDAPFTDDISFFCRFTAIQGCPLAVAEITAYDGPLNTADVLVLFNSKCSRYGLSPI